MKLFFFLILLALVVSVLLWALRKSQAEAELTRRKSLERRKKMEQEALAPEKDVTWPVIIRPVSGKHPPGKTSEAITEEPSMASIEFVSSDKVSSQAESAGSK